jgi:hypothetical protein
MSGCKSGLVAFAVLLVMGSPGSAQSVIPGGWSQKFEVQTITGADLSGGAALGAGSVGFGATVSPFGYGVNPYAMGVTPYGQYGSTFTPGFGRPVYTANAFGANAPPLTVNATDPLIHAIRQSVRTSRRR